MTVDKVKHFVLVASGKGGVGKSTVAVNLALALAKEGAAIGLLDADVHGPSLPTMLGKAKPEPTADGKGINPPVLYGLKVMSMGYLVENDAAVIWRGPMLSNAVGQLIDDVNWGSLDTLIFDLPPGTGDVPLTLAQKLKLTGYVLVTTPQNVALADVIRAKSMFDKLEVPCLGLVENMSYFICPDCHKRHEIFSNGGAQALAKEVGVPLLGQVPLESAVCRSGDSGRPIVLEAPDSPSAKAFLAIASGVRARMESELASRAQKQNWQSPLRIVNNN